MTSPHGVPPSVPPRITLEQATDLGAGLPDLLIPLLERRYLDDFQWDQWQLGTAEDDGSRPQLREVLGMARTRPGDEWSRAMPYVLTAIHGQGHAVVMTLFGDASRHRIFVGGRRMTAGARSATENFLDGQAGVLRAHVPGLKLGPAARLDDPAMSELSGFLREAPVTAVVTGVPSARTIPDWGLFQNIDRVAAAAGGHRYALVVSAEPLSAATVDRTIDRCRTLRSEIHTLVRRTVQQSRTESRSETTTDTNTVGTQGIALPAALAGLTAFCGMIGKLSTPSTVGLARVARIVEPSLMVVRQSLQSNQTVQSTVGDALGRSESAEVLDAGAEACETLLQRHIARLQAARGGGWWRTSVFLIAESEAAEQAVAAAVRGIASGEASALDPIRVVQVPSHLVRAAATRGTPITLLPSASAVGHPLGSAFDALATCTSSDELAIITGLPQREIPGLTRSETAEFALSAPAPTNDSIPLGPLLDSTGRALGPVTLTAPALNRHVLIAGMTGYGKSTTAQRLLLESWSRWNTPFLVIEPVKAEYRRLREHPALRGDLHVFAIGSDNGYPLRINPFQPQPGIPLLRHIDLLKAVFNASFPMFAGMSYVLEDAMLEIYTDRGWNLDTSGNDWLSTPVGNRAGLADLSVLTPTLSDLHNKIEHVLAARKYGAEVHQNLGAALRSRLRSLMVGAKGATLNTARSVPMEQLFTRPCVIELRNLGDDEEKAFVMALLLTRLYEYAEARQPANRPAAETLQHITLIEEAHRLLRAGQLRADPEAADPQAKAVTMFTDLLAEMRAYGEGFIVADQIPTKLAPEIIKNSNVKILHRLVAPDDRSAVASAIDLTPDQNRHLTSLLPGQAVVHDDRIGSAVLVGVQPLAYPATTLTSAPTTPDLSYLHRNSACGHCPAPCTLLTPNRRIESEADTDRALAPVFRSLVLGEPGTAWSAWQKWRAGRHSVSGRSSADADAAAYCAASQSAYRWACEVSRVRAEALGAAPDTPTDRLAVSRAAEALARFCVAWLRADTSDADVGEAFDDAHERVAAELASRPPRELPGCAGCPARCRMLAVVAALPAETRRSLGHRANAPLPVDTRRRNLDAVSDEALRTALTSLTTGPDRSALLYCAVVTAPDSGGPPEDLLAVLRTSS